MLYAGLDLSRQRLDVHVLDEEGRTLEVTAVHPDADALRTLATHVLLQGQEVTAAIESMTGGRFVHDQLERWGWDVAIADAVKVKGLAPLAAKTDRIDRRVLELDHAALMYSWTSPPRRSSRSMSGTPSASSIGARLSGTPSSRPRCGRRRL